MDRVHARRQSGLALIAVAGVMIVVALSLFAISMLDRGQRQLRIHADAAPRMAVLDAALARFVQIHRRLPCPARGTLASGVAGAGTESINLTTGQCSPTTQLDGVVPWVTLGLSENDALDAWQGRISYRVQPSLASNLLNLMNMSWCDPLGDTSGAVGPASPCAPAPCTSASCMHPDTYLYSKGLPVQDTGGAWLSRPSPPRSGPPPPSNGAAYVLISHGANRAGAYNAAGKLQAGDPVAGAQEASNRNGVALTAATVFVAPSPSGAPAPEYFDDLLSHPGLATVLGRAALGPRSPH